MNKIENSSLDITKLNIEKLKDLFPNVVTEGKINFDELREILGDEVDDSKEKYQFTWHGKAESIKLAQFPSTATLRPDKESSKNWDTTENLYIEGDNLEVLKQLQKTYYGKIKMIYIDPPYNTGNDFVYHDNFKNSIEHYKNQTNQESSSNPNTSGRFHTDWLNMMYPRLILSRNLLTEDGVIFISVDSNEFENLKKICDEIFGINNYRNTLLVRRRVKSLNSQFAENGLFSLNVGFEYILVYSKSSLFLMNAVYQKKLNASATGRWDVFWSNADRPTMRYELLGFTPSTGQWRNSKEKAEIGVENYKVYEKDYSDKYTLEEYSKKTGIINFIRRIPNGTGKNGGVQHWVAPSNVMLRTSNWTDIEVSQIGKEIDVPFDNPKSKTLLIELMKLVNFYEDDIILDFFSGSATTAHAVMELNKEDGGNRKFIMVQLPELCDEKSEAYKDGYKNICEIGKERIRRAGEQIKTEWEKEHPSDTLFSDNEKFTTDIGFKVFKLDSTNIRPWDSESEMSSDDLFSLSEVFKQDRSTEDILYEIMLKYGVFDKPAEEVEINEKTMYRVGKRYMIVCLENEITPEDVKAIAELSPRSVVFKESGFKNDNDKINAEYNLEKAGVEDVKCI